MVEGIIAFRIATHAGDIAKGIKGARDWETMFHLAIDGEKARRYRKESSTEHLETCTMCGKMCSARTMKKILNNESLDL